MRLISKAMKRKIAFRLGILWFYIRKLDTAAWLDVVEVFSDLCWDLGISWDLMLNGADSYEKVFRFEEQIGG